jgi:lipopolysaccharide/colanic/teichoic acid biosynthesis glycosyltransferase
LKELIVEKSGVEVYDSISRIIDIEADNTLVVSSTNIFNVLNHKGKIDTIINLTKVNNIRFINKYFEQINARLTNGDTYVYCFETYAARRRRKSVNKIPVLKWFYFLTEFIFLRVFPKVSGFKKLYFIVTRGRNRLLSKAEGLGRVVSCGFEIQEYFYSKGLLYVVTKKVSEPSFDMNPSYGPLYKMPRLGKDGKIIGVFKFRTMHPYAEYLHGYVLNQNGYAASGKPANDFRIAPWGKFLRKFWLDELPQLLNVLKGEMKLVGVRPISMRYFEDIPKDLQALRLTQKPGCIPPYVALDRKSNVQSVLQAEKEYLEEKLKHPYTTDTRYFFKAIFNIVVRRKRSA